jgi:Ca2+/Na+ antiporter
MFSKVINSKFVLVCLTIGVAMCTSSFAFEYGSNFDQRYAFLFAIALASLTFYYAKNIPEPVLMVMSSIATGGLLVFTIFVSSAAWLAKGTDKADPEIAVVRSQISSLESQISSRNLEIAGLLATGNPVNARQAGDHKAKLESQLNAAQTKLAQLEKSNGRFESGAMAIFGYMSKILNVTVEFITLLSMSVLTFVLVCMEVTLGAAATRSQIREIRTMATRTETKTETQPETKPEKPKLRKPKGATHKNRMILRTAILGGEPINYEALKTKYGVGRSTISSVIKELDESGHLEKQGKFWQRVG